jgi:transposase
MSYRHYPPPAPLLFGYDPVRDLPSDHLARLVEQVVEASVAPPQRRRGPGQPAFDPRLSIKVLVYGYATGQRSSRQLERLCEESLPYLFLTRGDTPSYRTLCSVRVEQSALLEQVWVALFAVADGLGLKRLGQIVVDSTKLRANASPDAVLTKDEYAAVRAELAAILAEAAKVDARESGEGPPGSTRLGTDVPPDQMRAILRRVRKQQEAQKQAAKQAAKQTPVGDPAVLANLPKEGEAPATGALTGGALGPPMCRRIAAALEALDEAIREEREHLCLTDPDARMMAEGREKKIRECHSFEVAVDREAGLLVVGQTTQESHDNTRLLPLVEAAREHEPQGVVAADGDSGYYSGDMIGELLCEGVDVCVPDSNTAGDLHRNQPVGTTRDRGQEWVAFVYDAASDAYSCPEGNILRPRQQVEHGGQRVMVYRAKRDCSGCERAGACLHQPGAKRRTLKVGAYDAILEAARQQFDDPEQRERYRHRARWWRRCLGSCVVCWVTRGGCCEDRSGWRVKAG